jgi:hypothetical protein
MTDDARLPGEPPQNPHADRPNWKPAETPDEYLTNCREGLELYSERRMAKLLGCSRIDVWRMRQMAELPDDLFERLMKLHRDGHKMSTKQLAQISVALQRGDFDSASPERCPHCGGELRSRYWISKAALQVHCGMGERRRETNRTMAMVARLQARWPRAFADPPRPLCIGVTDAILAQLRHPAVAHRITLAVGAAMEHWTRTPEYLKACTAGAVRVDLPGCACSGGEVCGGGIGEATKGGAKSMIEDVETNEETARLFDYQGHLALAYRMRLDAEGIEDTNVRRVCLDMANNLVEVCVTVAALLNEGHVERARELLNEMKDIHEHYGSLKLQ